MDETSVHDLFERVTETEPPIGQLAQRGIQAGVRLRRRRRVQNAVAGVAAIAVAAAAVAAATGALGRPGGQPAAAGRSGTLYVYTTPANARAAVIGPMTVHLTPIPVATNVAGTPVEVSQDGLGVLPSMTSTPDGKTIYLNDGSNAVQPVSTATGTAGQPIPFGKQQGNDLAQDIVAAPDGKTVYVIGTDGSVTPISTATSKPGKPFQPWGQDLVTAAAVTPDGKTIYVGVAAEGPDGPGEVLPVSSATGEAGKPIRLAGGADTIMITPDGRTAYVIGGSAPDFSFSGKIAVTPITTATNTAGPTVIAGRAYAGTSMVMTPDGQHIYIATANPFSLIPFATATNRAGKQISLGDQEIFALAAAPDGKTIYAASELNTNDSVRCPAARGLVTPVATATGKPGKPIQVDCTPSALAITPDSKTVYVASYHSGLGTVTPIVAATGQLGTPISVSGNPTAMLMTP